MPATSPTLAVVPVRSGGAAETMVPASALKQTSPPKPKPTTPRRRRPIVSGSTSGARAGPRYDDKLEHALAKTARVLSQSQHQLEEERRRTHAARQAEMAANAAAHQARADAQRRIHVNAGNVDRERRHLEAQLASRLEQDRRRLEEELRRDNARKLAMERREEERASSSMRKQVEELEAQVAQLHESAQRAALRHRDELEAALKRQRDLYEGTAEEREAARQARAAQFGAILRRAQFFVARNPSARNSSARNFARLSLTRPPATPILSGAREGAPRRRVAPESGAPHQEPGDLPRLGGVAREVGGAAGAAPADTELGRKADEAEAGCVGPAVAQVLEHRHRAEGDAHHQR